MKMTMLEYFTAALNAQTKWIEERGGDLAGYLAYYKTRPYDNVVAIFAADVAELKRLEEKCQRRRRS